MRQLLRLGTVLALQALAVPAIAQTTYYVDDEAPLGGDGLGWATAYPYLQDALVIAVAGDEIRLAEGLYLPDYDSAWFPDGSQWRPATFTVPAGVTVLGGYAGMHAPDPDERDPSVHLTTLSGDLLGDDLPDFINRGDNSLQVLTVQPGGLVVLDGLIIERGYGLDDDHVYLKGAGVAAADTSLELRNCTLRECYTRYGGAMHVERSLVTLSNCDLTGNWALSGAALRMEGGELLLDQCRVSHNLASGPSGLSLEDVALRLQDVDFISNTGEAYGTISMYRGTLEVEGCLFQGNTCRSSGAISTDLVPWISILDSEFISNSVTEDYGAAFLDTRPDGALEVRRCLFSGNIAQRQSGALAVNTTDMTIEDCIFINNRAEDGHAGALDAEAGAIKGCTFEGNSASESGGAVRTLSKCSFFECDFVNNQSAIGGAACLRGDSQPIHQVLFVNCAFLENGATDEGGAVHASERPQPTFINCLLNGNQAGGDGGAVYNDRTAGWFYNCTVTNNVSGGWGGGAFTLTGDITVTNSIFWGNTDTEGILERAQISNNGITFAEVAYSDVEGWTFSYGGPGMLDANPLFVDPLGMDGLAGTLDDDLRLGAGSTCIDAGDNDTVQHPFDLDLNQRRADDPNTTDTGNGNAPLVDMGAYEFASEPYDPCPGDLDGDGDVDQADLGVLLAAYGDGAGGDLDGDGDTDQADLGILLAKYGQDCA